MWRHQQAKHEGIFAMHSNNSDTIRFDTISAIVAFIACAAMIFGSTGVAQAAGTSTQSNNISAMTTQSVEEATLNLFTKVLEKNSSTKIYTINERARLRYAPEMDIQQLSAIRDSLNASVSSLQLYGVAKSSGWSYAQCVVLKATGIDAIVSIDWKKIDKWISQKAWKTLAKYLGHELPKHAAQLGLKGAFRLNVVILVGSLAYYAIKCA